MESVTRSQGTSSQTTWEAGVNGGEEGLDPSAGGRGELDTVGLRVGRAAGGDPRQEVQGAGVQRRSLRRSWDPHRTRDGPPDAARTVKGRCPGGCVNQCLLPLGSPPPFAVALLTDIFCVMQTSFAGIRLPLILLVLLVAACATGDPADVPTLPAVGLAGERVLLFPVQRDLVEGDADREMVFAIRGRSGSSSWVFPDEIRNGVARSPSLSVPVDDLPVDIFFQAEVERVGDPLYGMIRRAASLSGARRAVIPLSVSYRAPDAERPGAVEVFGLLLDVVTGRVLWLGTEEGAAGGSDDPGGLARSMEAFAGRFLPAG